jgi:ubiquinone/menaquinone biosynthesis C-methylase UbiE
MEKNPNLSPVIHAYSEGQIFERWARPEWKLADYEQRLMEAYCPNHEAAILNLGCGGGRETFALYHQGYRNLTGLDCTEPLLEMARRHDAEIGSRLEFVLGAVEEMPFPDERFDAVTFFENVYGHIATCAARRESMKEIARVIKPGGLVF